MKIKVNPLIKKIIKNHGFQIEIIPQEYIRYPLSLSLAAVSSGVLVKPDHNTLNEKNKRLFFNHYKKTSKMRYFDEGIFIILSNKQGVPVAFSSATFVSDNKKLRLDDFYVGSKKNGIGRLMMLALLDSARQCGITEIYLAPSEEGIPFYRKFGYRNMSADESEWDDMQLKLLDTNGAYDYFRKYYEELRKSSTNEYAYSPY